MSKPNRKTEGNQMVMATYPNRLGLRIKTSKILMQVQRCALGEIEMTSVQLNAAKLLINKTLPDAVQPKDTDHDLKDVSHVPTWKLLQTAENVVEGEVIEETAKP